MWCCCLFEVDYLAQYQATSKDQESRAQVPKPQAQSPRPSSAKVVGNVRSATPANWLQQVQQQNVEPWVARGALELGIPDLYLFLQLQHF